MSLAWNFAVQNVDGPCRNSVRSMCLQLCEEMAQRAMRARASIPPGQQMDIHYDAMSRDWRTQMRRIYGFAGMDWTADVEAAMGRWLDQSERTNLHGRHRYSGEDFGITTAEIDSRMMFYRQGYGIAYEAS
jgi:hypothetical protein